MELRQAIFTPDDIAQILQIPMVGHEVPDKLVWGGTTYGKFTVKSAYHLRM